MLTLQQVLKTFNWKDSYYDLYPGYSKPVKANAECMYDDQEMAEASARDLLEMVKSFPNPIPVYRTVGIKSLKDLDLDNPGWSWSWDEESAIYFAKNNGVPKPHVLLRGFAPKNKVDWISTLELYHDFSGAGRYDSENEIRIQGKYVKDIKAKRLKD